MALCCLSLTHHLRMDILLVARAMYHTPRNTSPNHTLDNYQVQQLPDSHSHKLVTYVDSDWATKTKKQTSMTGIVFTLSGGAIGYKSKFQTVIAHLSMEAEFVAACDTAKMILLFRSLLQDIRLEQEEATVLFEDNNGALLMANAQQPTKRTCHIDIKHFAILNWVEMGMLLLHDISMHDNAADAMTKLLTKQFFYCHYDTYMGLRIPKYCKMKQPRHPLCIPSVHPTKRHH
jgi:hypothetical protein